MKSNAIRYFLMLGGLGFIILILFAGRPCFLYFFNNSGRPGNASSINFIFMFLIVCTLLIFFWVFLRNPAPMYKNELRFLMLSCTLFLLILSGGYFHGIHCGITHKGKIYSWSEAEDFTWLQADQLAAAVNLYNKKNTGYPESLNDLVPDYIAEIPQPLYDEEGAAFIYINNGNKVTLSWYSGCRIYDFISGKWLVYD